MHWPFNEFLEIKQKLAWQFRIPNSNHAESVHLANFASWAFTKYMWDRTEKLPDVLSEAHVWGLTVCGTIKKCLVYM